MTLSLHEVSKNKLFSVEARISAVKNKIFLEFLVTGPLEKLDRTPSLQKNLRVGTDIWKKSCFECFFFQETSSYEELNFNENHEYCLLSFSDYRKAQNSEIHFEVTKLSFEKEPTKLSAKAEILIPLHSSFLCSPTAILYQKNGGPLYFAVEHGAKADFHLRQTIESKGFQLLT